MEKCTALPDCPHPVRCKGLCQAHYQQWRAGKPFTVPRKRRRKNEELPECSFPGICHRPAKVRGLCGTHYQQWRLKGELYEIGRKQAPRVQVEKVKTEKPKQKCLVCEEPFYCKGYCRRHYKKWRRYGDAEYDGPRLRRGSRIKESSSEDGVLLVELTGKHAQGRWTKIDEEDRHFIEGRKVYCVEDGYAQIYWEDKLWRLHRLFLGLAHGDHLEADHINGKRLDNRRENLRAVTKAEQAQNRKPWARSGHRNVHWDPGGKGRWKVIVKKGDETLYGGSFQQDELEAAVEKARQLRDELFTHHNEER